MGRSISSFKVLILFTLFALMRCGYAAAEPYVGVALGWQFDQKFSGLEGDESMNYPNAAVGVYPNSPNPSAALYMNTKYSNMNLKNTLSAGIRGGYYFKSLPSLGVELEFSYSQPKILSQKVKLTHPGFNDNTNGLGLGQDNQSEHQDHAKNQLFLLSLNCLYRYQGFKKITPYIGTGPGLFIFRITGTGHSGVMTDPASIVDPVGVFGPSIHQTSVNLGLSSKIGFEYNMAHNWGLGVEYHYNWSPVRISRFRSASSIDGNYQAQSVNLILQHYFS